MFLLTSTRRGVERSPSDLHYQGRKLLVSSFPIGIEPGEFSDRLESEAVHKQIAILQEQFTGMKIMIGVDRLDYIKGLPQKLMAYDKLLSDNPSWIGKVVLIQLAIPTRSEVEGYKKLRVEVEALIGHINGKHGAERPEAFLQNNMLIIHNYYH